MANTAPRSAVPDTAEIDSPGRLIASSTIGFSGWLRKLKVHPVDDGNPIKSSWHKRHFRIAGGFLAYYKNEESDSPAGWLRLAQISEVRCLNDGEVAPGVHQSDMPAATVRIQLVHRVLFLGTKDQSDAQAWQEAIQGGVSAARGIVPGASPSPRLAGRVRGGFEPRSPAASGARGRVTRTMAPDTGGFLSPGAIQLGLSSSSTKPPSKQALTGHGDSAPPLPRLGSSSGASMLKVPKSADHSKVASRGSPLHPRVGVRRALHPQTSRSIDGNDGEDGEDEDVKESRAKGAAVHLAAETTSPGLASGAKQTKHGGEHPNFHLPALDTAPSTPSSAPGEGQTGRTGAASVPPTLEAAGRSTTSSAPVAGTAVVGPDGSVWVQVEYVRSIDPASGHFYLTGVVDGVAHWSLPPSTRGAHWGSWVTVWDEVTACLYYLNAESGDTSFLSPGAEAWYAPAPQQVQAWPRHLNRGENEHEHSMHRFNHAYQDPGDSGNSAGDSHHDPGNTRGEFLPPSLDVGGYSYGGSQGTHVPAALLTTSTEAPVGGIDFSGMGMGMGLGSGHRAGQAAAVAAAQRGYNSTGWKSHSHSSHSQPAAAAMPEGGSHSDGAEDLYVEVWDPDSGYPYYWRIATGVAQWEVPSHTGAVVVRQGQPGYEQAALHAGADASASGGEEAGRAASDSECLRIAALGPGDDGSGSDSVQARTSRAGEEKGAADRAAEQNVEGAGAAATASRHPAAGSLDSCSRARAGGGSKEASMLSPPPPPRTGFPPRTPAPPR